MLYVIFNILDNENIEKITTLNIITDYNTQSITFNKQYCYIPLLNKNDHTIKQYYTNNNNIINSCFYIFYNMLYNYNYPNKFEDIDNIKSFIIYLYCNIFTNEITDLPKQIFLDKNTKSDEIRQLPDKITNPYGYSYEYNKFIEDYYKIIYEPNKQVIKNNLVENINYNHILSLFNELGLNDNYFSKSETNIIYDENNQKLQTNINIGDNRCFLIKKDNTYYLLYIFIKIILKILFIKMNIFMNSLVYHLILLQII